MEGIVKRQDWVWMFLKAFGIWLIAQAAISIPRLVWLGVRSFGEYSTWESADMFYTSLEVAGVQASLGFYFLLGGKLVLRIITPKTIEYPGTSMP
jgi:hypothetical protein